jgi:hypothetical protein
MNPPFRSLLVGVLLAGLSSSGTLTPAADVYRSIGPDGRPVFTDRPLPDATRLPLPGGGVPVENSSIPPPAEVPERGFFGSYESFEIANPQEGATIRNKDGVVGVSLLLDPSLMESHRIRVDVDGTEAVGHLGNRTQMTLHGVAIGSHRLQALVVDGFGNVVSATPVVHFHVREPLPEGVVP